MAIIYTYPKLTNPQGNELIVVTDVNNKNSTRLITVADIAGLIPSGPSGCTEAIKGITDATGLGILYEAVACSYPKFQSTDNSILITSTGINDGLDFVVADAGCDNVFSTVTADGGGDPIADGCDDVLDFTSLDNSVTIITSGNDVDFSVASSPGEGCTTAITSLFPSSGDNIIADACDFGVALTGTGGITVTGTAPGTITFDLNYTVPCATNSTIGGFHANIVGIGPPPASQTGTYYPVEITEGAPCTGIVRIPDSATSQCATTFSIGGIKVGATDVDVQPQLSGGTPEWVQLTQDCGAFVNIPDSTGCSDVYKNITCVPSGDSSSASGCNDTLTFTSAGSIDITLPFLPVQDWVSFDVNCATSTMIGGIKVTGDPLVISPPTAAQDGNYYPVQVSEDCEAVVRVPDSTIECASDVVLGGIQVSADLIPGVDAPIPSDYVYPVQVDGDCNAGVQVPINGQSGIWTPILITQGANGTAIAPFAYDLGSAGITYSQASGYYQIVGNIVYMDFFLEFSALGQSLTVPLQKSLGIGWNDVGILKHLGQLPGLTDLNVNQPNNTTVTISRAECYTTATGDVDTAEWEVMPQTGMLNRYPDFVTPGVQPFMWLAGHIYVDDPTNSRLQTNYSPNQWITLTTDASPEGNPIQKAILAGSMTAVLRPT